MTVKEVRARYGAPSLETVSNGAQLRITPTLAVISLVDFRVASSPRVDD